MSQRSDLRPLEAIMSRHLQGQPLAEIAQQVGRTTSAVMGVLHRGLVQLRTILDNLERTMSDETQAQRKQRLNGVLAAHVEADDAGQTPDRAEILARHPDLAAEMEAFFADHDRLNRPATAAK